METASGVYDKRLEIKEKLRQNYDGKIVRKDLTKKIKGRRECPGLCFGISSGPVLQLR